MQTKVGELGAYRTTEEKYEANEVDIDEDELWREVKGPAVPQSIYKVTDRLEREMEAAVRALDQFGDDDDGNGPKERAKTAQKAVEVWEGFNLLSRIRRAQVHEYRKVSNVVLEDVERKLKEALTKRDEFDWDKIWADEADCEKYEKDMWKKGEEGMAPRKVYQLAGDFRRSHIQALSDYRWGLQERRFRSSTEIEGLKAEAQHYAEKAAWYGELAEMRRERYIEAKKRKMKEGEVIGEANTEEVRPGKRVKTEE